MMIKVIWIFTVFVSLIQCERSTSIKNIEEEKDLDLLSEMIKEITDPCPELCQNGGVCVVTDNGFMCICTPPYFGKTCNEDPCTRNPCRNGGKCQIEKNGFMCLCKLPYRGENCTLDACLPNPCENDGKCKIIGDSFNCTCKNPHYGDTCEFGPCHPNPCKNEGECDEDGESFKCTCESPFMGSTCEQTPCSPNPCQNAGKCSITNDFDFKCTCNKPFSGKTCEKGPCTPNPCQNGGNCTTYENGRKCICDNAYFGEYCEKGNNTEPDISTTTTTDSVLVTNVTYQNITELTDSYSWTSPESTTDENATAIIDRNSTHDMISSTLEEGNLKAFQKGCEADSDCLNEGVCKKYSCSCEPNFGGSRCEVILPCVGLEQSCRIINAVCVLIDNRAICECPNGTLYHRRSGLCEDICDPRKCLHGTCEIIGKTYKCNCDQGYTGNHCDETERRPHENFVPWFTVIATINIFICILLIGMFCVVCHIKRFITTA